MIAQQRVGNLSEGLWIFPSMDGTSVLILRLEPLEGARVAIHTKLRSGEERTYVYDEDTYVYVRSPKRGKNVERRTIRG